MLGLNQMKKFIYLLVFLVGLSFSSSAWSNAEISGHFGMKFGSKLNLDEVTTVSSLADQKNMPFHFGADALYRHMMNETGSFGVGLRYRFAFTGERDVKDASGNDTPSDSDKYKFIHHRIALLANYRFHMDQFFVGPVIGIDIWKSLRFSYINTRTGGSGASQEDETYIKSNQFLWNQISGQLGLELGYKATENLLVKLEAGYDLSSFGDLKCNSPADDTEAACKERFLVKEGTGENAETKKLNLNGFYATLGIGWFFG